ncbi:MAG: tRNA (adenosine(37)-N6)-threonylcarbamoyltransferase complex ATPase subunit type 1 TsaE [Flavobacteriales bacterium]|nr:tRNA (adenosine(37)-N6)-threonylcarbamoyltransferase complex ATPase subunit type 1 TsaE [Flavobacteriales bacterium]MBT5698805.1 tRNA (adenosine(37)-N6)-threonylcarbamoyltransferase complex ATPase subunit type 1 TsaE [Flavobacteriales bacterium]MBT6699942.1 tRNA (adenosine(37)-N6)-threonylcarbamoyltransferase complex ATPase subunit type 1 TsaE [Flavobacteriales bacterium]MBT6815264.1 tRNA (adenosine(37)-N6)-threonylcarbamoyltransferase complex ATPase subunit type 1 TsaE [Flavobacteriales bact
MKIVVNCVSELELVATSLLELINDNNIICFHGEMGVGKTTFIKEICKKLGVEDVVSSPTFSIINEYLTENNESVYHFDFYRIEKEEEAFDIGYEEYFYQGNLCLIEWPEKISSIIPENIIKVQITRSDEQRIIEII